MQKLRMHRTVVLIQLIAKDCEKTEAGSNPLIASVLLNPPIFATILYPLKHSVPYKPR